MLAYLVFDNDFVVLIVLLVVLLVILKAFKII